MRLTLVFLLGSLTLGVAACESPLEAEDEALASQEYGLGWFDPDYPWIDEPWPRWRNIPILVPSLQIHVCDEEDAGTDDYVTARFQVGTALRSFTLDKPGNDFERDGTYTYYLPTLGGTYQQLNDIANFRLDKTGEDGLCMDRIPLSMHGVKVWEYTRDEPKPEKHWKLVDWYNSGYTGKIWLDQGAPSYTTKVRFTERMVDAARQGKVDVEITVCDLDKAGTDDTVRVSWVHDQIAEPFKTLDTDDFNDFERDSKRRYALTGYDTIEWLDEVRIEKDGTDGLCIAKVALVDGDRVLASRTVNKWLDGDGSGWVGIDAIVDEPVSANGVSGWIGYSFSQTYFAISLDESIRGNPDGNHPECRLPTRISHQAIEGVIETLVAGKLRGKGYDWGNNSSTSVSYWSKSSVAARTSFKSGQIGANMDFRISFGCPDGRFELKATPASVEKFGIEAGYQQAMVDLFDGWDATSWLRLLAPVKACPTVSVEEDGDVLLTWPKEEVNARCQIDSDKRFEPNPR